MRGLAAMQGFDYRNHSQVNRSVAEWRHEMRTLIEKQKAFRRVESDKDGPVTYLHETYTGHIIFEIYGNVKI